MRPAVVGAAAERRPAGAPVRCQAGKSRPSTPPCATVKDLTLPSVIIVMLTLSDVRSSL